MTVDTTPVGPSMPSDDTVPIEGSASTERPTLVADLPVTSPPGWALAERSLLALLEEGWRLFGESYTRPDGSLRYERELTTRDGADDFMEPFFNWPQLYLLGGSDELLRASERHWHGVAAQLTDLGMYRDEFEVGYDWFHQGESMLFFYFLTMADPSAWTARAVRFADLYVDPRHGNYDAERRIVKAPHNGSGGARAGVADTPSYAWTDAEAAQYGYPLDWLVPDGETPPRDADPRLGREMQERLGRGDAVGNLSIAGLVLNAYVATREPRFRDWITAYVGAWHERARANGGVVPDNVGLDGVVGSQLDGRWYGGHYGWSWPHGLYSLGQASLVGAMAAAVATGDDEHLDLPRNLYDGVIGRGRQAPFSDSDSSLVNRWRAHLGEAVDTPTLLVPYRVSDKGWFDWNPVQTSVPMALWHRTGSTTDRERLDLLRARSGYDWATVRPFRDKEEAGHEEPWYAFLCGENPDYPEQILAVAHTQARRRIALLRANAGRDLEEEHIHLWQNVNPVVTEALVQLTWGGPQVVYNGGLQQARVRYLDPVRRRPGLPEDVAALVSSVDPEATVVTLVNLSATTARPVTVQAGALAEHRVRRVRFTHTAPDGGPWTGHDTEYLHRQPAAVESTLDVDGPWFDVELAPGTTTTLTLQLELNALEPTYATPYDAGDHA